VGVEEHGSQVGLEGLDEHAGSDFPEEVAVANRAHPGFGGLGEGEEDAAGEDGLEGFWDGTLREGDKDGAGEKKGEGRGRADEGEEMLASAPTPLVGRGPRGGGDDGIVEAPGVEAFVGVPAKGLEEEVGVGGETGGGRLGGGKDVLGVEVAEEGEGVVGGGEAVADEGSPRFAKGPSAR
jgi:hypothetical protein